MEITLNKEQKLLRHNASEFLARLKNTDLCGQNLEVDSAKSRSLLIAMATQGWFSILVPSRAGGLGLGVTDLALVMEIAGKGLFMDPIAEFAVAAWAISVGDSATGLGSLLVKLMAGEQLILPVINEYQEKDHEQTGLVSTNEHHGYQLSGNKLIVPFPVSPDYYLVDASTQDGTLIYVVPSKNVDLNFERNHKNSDLRREILRIPGIFLNEDALVSGRKEGAQMASNIFDRILLANVGRYLGLAEVTLNSASDHLKMLADKNDFIEEANIINLHLKSIAVLHKKLRFFLFKTCRVIDNGNGNRLMVAEVATASCRLGAYFSKFEGEIQRTLPISSEHFLMQLLKQVIPLSQRYGTLDEHQKRAKRLILEQEKRAISKERNRRKKRRRSIFSKINN